MTLTIISLSLLIAIVLAGARLKAHFITYDGNWHVHYSALSDPVLMKRRTRGKWEYREMTEAERQEEFQSVNAMSL
jgi:hypothetical protein